MLKSKKLMPNVASLRMYLFDCLFEVGDKVFFTASVLSTQWPASSTTAYGSELALVNIPPSIHSNQIAALDDNQVLRIRNPRKRSVKGGSQKSKVSPVCFTSPSFGFSHGEATGSRLRANNVPMAPSTALRRLREAQKQLVNITRLDPA